MESLLSRLSSIVLDEEFRRRVSLACYIVAYDIATEDFQMSNPVRHRLSEMTLQQDQTSSERLASMVITHPLIQDLNPASGKDISDEIICRIILNSWNKIAGLGK